VPTSRRDGMRASLGQLSGSELLILETKLSRAKRRALQAATHSGSVPEIWDMIRIINDLTEVADDVDRVLTRVLPS
jgi:hypothetical protein